MSRKKDPRWFRLQNTLINLDNFNAFAVHPHYGNLDSIAPTDFIVKAKETGTSHWVELAYYENEDRAVAHLDILIRALPEPERR